MRPESFLAVIEAFCLTFGIICQFGIMGVILFENEDEVHFKTFSKSLLTLFQVATLDDWADITRGLAASDGTLDRTGSVFFIFVIVIITYGFLQVRPLGRESCRLGRGSCRYAPYLPT
jgi:hypothetical protein